MKKGKFIQVVPWFAGVFAVITGFATQSPLTGLMSFPVYYIVMSFLR